MSVRKVMTSCPTTGKTVATHAAMTRRRFERFRGELVFFCTACRQSHAVPRPYLYLEGDAPKVLRVSRRLQPVAHEDQDAEPKGGAEGDGSKPNPRDRKLATT